MMHRLSAQGPKLTCGEPCAQICWCLFILEFFTGAITESLPCYMPFRQCSLQTDCIACLPFKCRLSTDRAICTVTNLNIALHLTLPL